MSSRGYHFIIRMPTARPTKPPMSIVPVKLPEGTGIPVSVMLTKVYATNARARSQRLKYSPLEGGGSREMSSFIAASEVVTSSEATGLYWSSLLQVKRTNSRSSLSASSSLQPVSCAAMVATSAHTAAKRRPSTILPSIGLRSLRIALCLRPPTARQRCVWRALNGPRARARATKMGTSDHAHVRSSPTRALQSAWKITHSFMSLPDISKNSLISTSHRTVAQKALKVRSAPQDMAPISSNM
mmetsp:Transcript_63363/g.196286  ORF Transcript_63363/g.196286 Transcript_63363/m.196286 type:complete len:242 (-) Transcript_63363:815-1540(-)